MNAYTPIHEVDELRAEIERLRSIVRDLLWAIGHDDEKILNETTARAKAALKDTTGPPTYPEDGQPEKDAEA